MRVKVYQINREKEKSGTVPPEYNNLSERQKLNYINASLYDEVFSGDVEYDSIEDLENMFNENGHPLYRGAEKYMKIFAEPETISQQEVEADMGFKIYGFWF